MPQPAIDPRQASSPVPIYNADGTYNDDYIRHIVKRRKPGGFMPRTADDEVHDGGTRGCYGAVAQNRQCDYDDV